VAAATAEANALSDETLQRTLLLAQKFVDQTKRESEAEAAAVVAQAEETARAAIARPRRHRRNCRPRRTRSCAKRSRGSSHPDRAGHRRREHGPPLESERNRLRGALSEILKWVDENVQPANSLMGVKPMRHPRLRPMTRTPRRGCQERTTVSRPSTCRARPFPEDPGPSDPSAGQRALLPLPLAFRYRHRSPARFCPGDPALDVVRRRER